MNKKCMKKIVLTFVSLLMGGLCSVLVACSDEEHTVPVFPEDGSGEIEIKPDQKYDWETNRQSILANTDMVLLYSGGDQRLIWTQERAQPYITYVDEQNTPHWFFDSFLMLEILNTSDNWQTVREYTKGMRYESATKAEWMKLIDCYFNSETGIAAIEAGVKKAMTTMGAPAYKRQVIIGIPEPIDVQNELVSGSSSVYWGEIDNMSLDFSKPADRVKACKWFIDQVRARFSEKEYQYVDLAGFYWIAEDASHTGNIITPIANYLNDLKYSFNWIPFFNSDGHESWKELGFHYAYYQPNYYFDDKIPLTRLDEACKEALRCNMQMEIEFEDDVLAAHGKAYRLENYMAKFKEYGVWEKCRFAYYQSNNALLTLKYSSEPADVALYHKFCKFVIERPIRDSH